MDNFPIKPINPTPDEMFKYTDDLIKWCSDTCEFFKNSIINYFDMSKLSIEDALKEMDKYEEKIQDDIINAIIKYYKFNDDKIHTINIKNKMMALKSI